MKTSIAMLVLMLVVTTLAGAGELKEDLVTLEKDAWKAWSKGDGDFFRKNLTEDHVQVVAGPRMWRYCPTRRLRTPPVRATKCRPRSTRPRYMSSKTGNGCRPTIRRLPQTDLG
jgi:hypothetical protein